MIFCLLAYWVSVVVDVHQQKNHVDVSNVSLGVLRPGSKVEFSVTLYNGGRELALRPIRTSCGCLAPNREKPIVLMPGENVLKFAYSAPSSPEIIEQEVWFFAEKGTPSAWSATIDGEVAADVWAVPSRLTLRCDDSLDNPSGTFTLHHPNRTIKSITTSPDSLTYNVEQVGEYRRTIFVSCDSVLPREVLEKGKFTGSLSIEFEEAYQEGLEVLVDLVPKPKFSVHPARIDFSQSMHRRLGVRRRGIS